MGTSLRGRCKSCDAPVEEWYHHTFIQRVNSPLVIDADGFGHLNGDPMLSLPLAACEREQCRQEAIKAELVRLNKPWESMP